MFNRLLNLSALLSAIAFCLVGFAWFIAGNLDPRTQHLNLGRQWHLGLHARGSDARLDFFNGSNGPYRGGIISMTGPVSPSLSTPPASAFGDTLGIYLRQLPIAPGISWWTLSLSLAYPSQSRLCCPQSG